MTAETATVVVGVLVLVGQVINGVISSLNSRALSSIHVLVNSNLTAVKDQLSAALQEIKGLRGSGDDQAL